MSPWALEWWLHQRMEKRIRRQREAWLVRTAPRESERYEAAIGFLLERGLDEYAVRVGSIPERSLEYVCRVIRDHLPDQAPVRALHIGNFVGVSLCYLSWLVRGLHPSSVVISIDPNQPHLGVEDPEGHTRALLEHFGLSSTNLIIRGYTMAATLGADGNRQHASENVLESLKQVCGGAFDLVFVDGNHDESYLTQEFGALRELLADKSVVMFDDISDFEGVTSVFRQALRDDSVIPIGQDDRVGIVEILNAR